MYKKRVLQQPDRGYFNDDYANSAGNLPYYLVTSAPDETFSDANFGTIFKESSRMQYVGCPFGVEAGGEEFLSSEYKAPKWNECTHTKLSLRQIKYATAIYWFTGGAGIYYQYATCTEKPYASLPTYLKGYKLANMLTIDVSSAQRRAWWEMQPRFKGGLSMINSLYELKDFRGLARDLTSLTKRLWRDGSQLAMFEAKIKARNYVKELTIGKAASDTSLALSEGLLMTNFAIRPLLSDIAAITVNLQTLAQNASKQFLVDGLDPFTTHYTEFITHDEDVQRVSFPEHSVQGQREYVKYTCSMERTYSYRPLNAYDTFVKYWGLDLSPEALWNALPFSFLVDYILAVGKSLHQMQVDKNVDLNVRQYAESTLSEASKGEYVYPKGNGFFTDGSHWTRTSVSPPIHVVGYKSTCYRRTLTSPNYGPALPRLKSPTTTQMLNVAALIRCFC